MGEKKGQLTTHPRLASSHNIWHHPSLPPQSINLANLLLSSFLNTTLLVKILTLGVVLQKVLNDVSGINI